MAAQASKSDGADQVHDPGQEQQLQSGNGRENEELKFPNLLEDARKPVKLDIGGSIFKTSLETLKRDSDTKLTKMFSGQNSVGAQEDAVFIDRDPTHFRFILNFLRTGEIILPNDPVAREELLLETKFYGIKPMTDRLTHLQYQHPSASPHEEFVGSTLMRDTDKTNLLSWLNGKIRWQLFYKGSRDGFKAFDFHRTCDNKGETVSVIQTTDDWLFGGYTDVPWTSPESGEFKHSTESFLFAFRSLGLGSKAVKTDVVDKAKAVLDYKSYSCTFGGGYNIHVADYCNTNNASYSNWNNGEFYKFPTGITEGKYWLTGQRCFMVRDIEVFGHSHAD